jgi:GDP-4-dehydro-6-deoxy-D-mannose reductase
VDVLDREAVHAAVRAVRPAVVYHMAGAAHAGRSWDQITPTLRVNVLGTHNLLAALADIGGPCRVLVPGSALVYRPQDRALTERDELLPGSPYGLSKLAQEMTAQQAGAASGVEVLLTRSFNHIGPRQDPSFFAASFARQVARIELGRLEPVLRVGNVDARRDLTDVRDTVRAYRDLVRAGLPGRPYNVCCGQAHRVGDILDGLLKRATVPIEVRQDRALHRPNDAGLVLGDRSRITAETGWTPQIPLDRTLDDLLAYWRGREREEAHS